MRSTSPICSRISGKTSRTHGRWEAVPAEPDSVTHTICFTLSDSIGMTSRP